MRRTWFTKAVMASFISMGSAVLQAQSPRCDAPDAPHAACTECRDYSGFRIPSLQFLVVDRLSAAGDRFERSFKTAPSRIPMRTCKPKPLAPRREASCGIERLPIQNRPCDQLGASGRISDRSAISGSISDVNEKPVAPRVPTPPPFAAFPSKTPEPDAPAPFSPPKLLRTPVSTGTVPAEERQVDEPKLTDIPQLPSSNELPPAPELPLSPPVSPSAQENHELPRVENVPMPPPPEQPLPDILVDPFIEDVSHRPSTRVPGVIQTSATRPIPVNPLRASVSKDGREGEESDLPKIRTGEPKRLTTTQKMAGESPIMQGNSPRTLILRSFHGQQNERKR